MCQARVVCRLLLLLLIACSSGAYAMNELLTPRARVLYQEPGLAAYAQRVAAAAERALDVLEPLFGPLEGRVTLRVRDDTDVYNAFATPVPHRYVDLRALFPTGSSLSLRAEDDLFLLVLHELTHVAQLAYVATPESEGGGLRLGLVGEEVARVPPAWFLEGVATWVESEYTAGGRRDEASTQGLLWTLALADSFPSLSEAGLGVYEAWPGGSARYLLGVGFTQHLVDAYGFDALLATLRHYNAAGFLGTFSAAFAEATGGSLQAEWQRWHEALRREAARNSPDMENASLTDTGWTTGAAALSPEGTHLAWLSWPPAIRLGTLSADGRLTDERTLLRDRQLERLSWLDDHTLVYSRTVRRPGTQFRELFALELASGRETQLTQGARAHFATATPEGCVLYVQDDATAGSSLLRWCEGAQERLWQTGAGQRIVGLALSPRGRLALSLWEAGQVDLAVLENLPNEPRLRYLTRDAASDLDPSWQDDGRLLFASDRSGSFEIYRLEPGTLQLERLSDTLGGAYQPLATGEQLIYRRLGAEGYDLARADLQVLETAPLALEPVRSESDEAAPRFEVRPYSPWPSLAPYGWLPQDASLSLQPFGLSLAASLLGQDLSNQHSYALTLGYASQLRGPLGGVHASFDYRYRANSVLTSLVPPYPLGLSFRLGLWPQQTWGQSSAEVALGAKLGLELHWPLDQWTLYGVLETGLVRLPSYPAWQPEARLELLLSQRYHDAWGYPTRGSRVGLSGLVSASAEGPRAASWASASYHLPVALGALSGPAEFALSAGYRPASPLPVAPQAWGAIGTLGYRLSLDAPWRYGDGLYSLERLTLEPRLRLWLAEGFGLGGDLSLYADTLVNYAAPVSFGVTLGYAESFWYRFGLRLPL